MPWNEADRIKCDVIRARCTSDMSEAEFALIAPLPPSPKRRGRKPTDPQVILNALFYMIRCSALFYTIRCSCSRRCLPKDFPPFTTVQNRFYAWRDCGLWTQIVAVIGRFETHRQSPNLTVFESMPEVEALPSP
jgi:transposase